MIKWIYDEHEFHTSDQAAAGEKQDPEIQLQEIAAEVIKQRNTPRCSVESPTTMRFRQYYENNLEATNWMKRKPTLRKTKQSPSV